MSRCVPSLLLTVLAISTAEENCRGDGTAKLQSSSLVQLKALTERTAPKADEGLNSTETDFIKKVMTSFGKQKPDYSGEQRLIGFQAGTLIDEKGMFAFDESIKSVAIDVGAANNPLIFDMDRDSSQMVLAFEPVFHEQLGEDMEIMAKAIKERGGCTSRWEPHCSNRRLVVFPSAVSSEIGHAKFTVAANPYCSSLNTVPGGLDETLVNSPDPEVRDVMAACWGSLKKSADVREVPTLTLSSILSRIPKHIRVKYVKIDAQGQDYKVLLSAADQMSRIEYVRFEMQVDPPKGRKMVQDIPSYDEVVSKMTELGFVHETPACHWDAGVSPFSKAINEKECVFCRELPCREGGVEPLGENPRNLLENKEVPDTA